MANGGFEWPAGKRVAGKMAMGAGRFLNVLGAAGVGGVGYEVAKNFQDPAVAVVAGVVAVVGVFGGTELHERGTINAVQAVMEMKDTAPIIPKDL